MYPHALNQQQTEYRGEQNGMPSTPTRVIVADDDVLLREGGG